MNYEPKVHYILVTLPELETSIVDAIEADQHFYIGAASDAGSPMQSMCHREGTECEPDATGCNQASSHRADKAAEALGQYLVKVFLINRLVVKKGVCELEKELIDKYRPKEGEEDNLCLNEASGRANCIKGDKGIVYVRIYE